MKWFKGYAVVLFVMSLLLLVLSFFFMDISPWLYQLYTGHEISSSKLDKLHTFALETIYQVRVYAILLLVTSLAIYRTKSIKAYGYLLLFFLTVHFIFIAEIGELVVIRRFYQMLIMLPLLWIFFDYFKFREEPYEKKITHGFLYITLLCIVLPGLYLPPFFTGIPGWTVEIDKEKPFVIEGIFLIRKDGKEIRYSRAIVSPVNFVTRLNQFILVKHPDKVHDLLTFYKEVYIKRYDILKQGYMPNEEKLGKLAYPIHNPYGAFDYAKFPPSSLKEIRLSKKYYHWDKRFIKEEVVAREVW